MILRAILMIDTRVRAMETHIRRSGRAGERGCSVEEMWLVVFTPL